jgi:predicted nucleic acid-binding protein
MFSSAAIECFRTSEQGTLLQGVTRGMEQTSGKRPRRARKSGAIGVADTECGVTAEDRRLVPLALIDTSVWLHALNKPGNATIQSLLRPLIVAGQAAITESILLEVIARTRRPEDQEELLDQFAWVTRLAFDSSWWRQAHELAAGLRRAGRAPPGDSLQAQRRRGATPCSSCSLRSCL